MKSRNVLGIFSAVLILSTLSFASGSSIFITELADPNNEAGARFVELFNNSDSEVNLGSGWQLCRYTNDNADPQTPVDLTGKIPAHGFYIVCADGSTFETTFGFTADQDIGTGGPADSNGDDNIFLIDPDGNTVDFFGRAGEDGSGTDHEFEDGRAERKSTVTTGNPTFDPAEWDIDNDSGGGDGPIDAPDGFDPNVWFSYTDPVSLPTITSSYSISLTEIQIKYNQDLTSVNAADYSVLGSTGITISTAEIDASDASIVKLTTSVEVYGDAVLDTLIDSANSDSVVFYVGGTSISFLNTNNPDGTLLNGFTASFKAIVSANDAFNNVWISDTAGAYSGILIYDYDFDGEVNVGDEIMLTATRTTYNNLSELKNPELIQIVSTGNAPYGPSLIAGADLDMTLAADTDPAEKWEGQLVKIADAKVLSFSASDYEYTCSDDNGATSFKVGSEVDYQLQNVAMDVGSTYDIVGVVDYNSGEYRINPRGADDIVRTGQAGITKARSVSPTEIEIIYADSLYSVDPANYSVLGTAGITISAAEIDPADFTHVKLTASADIVGDAVLDTLVDAANQDSIAFYIGITPLALTNTLNPDGKIEEDYTATFKGIVYGNDAYSDVWFADGSGAYHGLSIYNNAFVSEVAVGDEIIVSATLDVYNNMTELKNPGLISKTSGATPYGAFKIKGADIDTSLAADTNPAEQYENQLVKIDSARVLAYDNYQYYCTDDGVTTFKVSGQLDYHLLNVPLEVGGIYNITGPIDFYYGFYCINPRDSLDAEYLDTPPSDFSLISPADGDTITDADIVSDSLLQVIWHKADDPDGDIDYYEFNMLKDDALVYAKQLTDTSNYIKAPSWEDNGTYYWFVVAFDSYGAFSVSDTFEIYFNRQNPNSIKGELSIPKVFALHQNYPNPFNPVTTIKYDLPKDTHVKIVIYNIIGREVRTLVNEKQSAGYQQIQWNARDNYGKQVSSGYYIYMMQAGDFHKIHKMILIK
jgi:hypothetical protein